MRVLEWLLPRVDADALTASTKDGWCLLHTAARAGHGQAVEMVLRRCLKLGMFEPSALEAGTWVSYGVQRACRLPAWSATHSATLAARPTAALRACPIWPATCSIVARAGVALRHLAHQQALPPHECPRRAGRGHGAGEWERASGLVRGVAAGVPAAV